MANEVSLNGRFVLVRHTSFDLAIQALAVSIVADIRKAQLEPGFVWRMAVSGGTSPAPLYAALARASDLDWDRLEVYLVDERFVPRGHTDNNADLVVKAFGPSLCHFYPPQTSGSVSLEVAAQAYADLIDSRLGQHPVFDCIVLGMGADGHTASLFPGTGAAERMDASVIGERPLTAPHERISLSLPVLKAAKRVVFLVGGQAKRDMLKQVIEGPRPEYPASLVLPNKGLAEFWVDAEASP